MSQTTSDVPLSFMCPGLSRCIVVRIQIQTVLNGRRQKRLEQRIGDLGFNDFCRTAVPSVNRIATFITFTALEIRQTVRILPIAKARIAPAIIVSSISSHPIHAVNR